MPATNFFINKTLHKIEITQSFKVMRHIKVMFIYYLHLLGVVMVLGQEIQMNKIDIKAPLLEALKNTTEIIDFVEEKYLVQRHGEIQENLLESLLKCPLNLDLESLMTKYGNTRNKKCFSYNGRYTGTDMKVMGNCCVV